MNDLLNAFLASYQSYEFLLAWLAHSFSISNWSFSSPRDTKIRLLNKLPITTRRYFFFRLLTLKAAHLMDTVGNKVPLEFLHNFSSAVLLTFVIFR